MKKTILPITPFDEFWKDAQPIFNDCKSVSRTAARLGWNAALEHTIQLMHDHGMSSRLEGAPQKVQIPIKSSSGFSVVAESTVKPKVKRWTPEEIAARELEAEEDEAARLAHYPKHPVTGIPVGYYGFDLEEDNDSEICFYTGYDSCADDCPPAVIDAEVERILLDVFPPDRVELSAAQSYHIVYTDRKKDHMSRIRIAFASAGWKKFSD